MMGYGACWSIQQHITLKLAFHVTVAAEEKGAVAYGAAVTAAISTAAPSSCSCSTEQQAAACSYLPILTK
jgi:hypothetical protein